MWDCKLESCILLFIKTGEVYTKGWSAVYNQRLNKQEKTKHKLAASIKECMKTTSLDRITVADIVGGCGMSRQTFYRKFRDKYDLINWYFDELLLQYFAEIGKGEAIKEGLEQKFTFMLEEKNFYIQAFKHEGQNSLKEHDLKLILWYYRKLIEEKTGQELTEEMDFMLHFFCCGCVYMTAKWVMEGMKDLPEQLAERLAASMPVELAGLFESIRFL